MNNKKGFTLIELLAVIVILAILVLLAMPAVTSIIESSARNTFKNEILGVVKTMESAYTEKWGNGDIVSDFDDDAKIHTVTKDDKTYSYLCMSLKQLYEEQYIKKNLGDNYGGYIQMYVGDTDTYTYINTTNGTYYMQGEYGALSASTYEPSKSNNGKEVTKTTTCPDKEDDLDTPGTGGSTGGESGGETPTEPEDPTPSGAVATIQGKIGEELVDDETEDHNLRYIGADPDNYVYYNCSTTNTDDMNDTTCEKWRIIGVFNNIEIGNGTKKSLLKIRRADSIGTYSWDSSASGINNGNGINQWGPSGTYPGADLMRELNYDYYYDDETEDKADEFSNGWYDDDNEGRIDVKPSRLKEETKNMIEEVVWSLGSPNNNNGTYVEYDSSLLTAPYIYTHERAETNGKICSSSKTGCNDTVERTSTWTGKVGLIYPSDYLYATKDNSRYDRATCLTKEMNIWYEYGCYINDWLYYYKDQWTISPVTLYYFSNRAYRIPTAGHVESFTASTDVRVFPVVFLKSNVEILDGDGSSENPYKLSMN